MGRKSRASTPLFAVREVAAMVRSYNLDDAVQQRINAPPAPPPPPSLAARRHMVHPSDDDGSSDRGAWHFSFL